MQVPKLTVEGFCGGCGVWMRLIPDADGKKFLLPIHKERENQEVPCYHSGKKPTDFKYITSTAYEEGWQLAQYIHSNRGSPPEEMWHHACALASLYLAREQTSERHF